MSESMRDDAVAATHILNDMVGDFVAPVIVAKDYQQRLKAIDKGDTTALVALNKMCLSYIILSFAKWLEFYSKYHRLFDGELHETCKDLTRKLQNQQVTNFRNSCIGHILDKKTKSPLFPSEINSQLMQIIGNDMESFLIDIHNINGNKYPETVVSIVEEARNYLAQKFNISHQEIMGKNL